MFAINRLAWFCIICLIYVHSTCSQQTAKSYSCKNKDRCYKCIQTAGCAWCKDEGKDIETRCFNPITDVDSRKSCEDIYDPETEFLMIRNESLTASTDRPIGSVEKNIIQLYPQEVDLKMRINKEYTMKVKFGLDTDAPVDLYYLMDLSNSMENDKDKLAALGVKLTKRMKEITTNFRLGFGSFVDKPILPYSRNSLQIKHLNDIQPAYSFKHAMNLSEDGEDFARKVEAALISGNIDAPEGGFDALMQVMVCPHIGWRPQATRLIIFSTDDGFHIAGDGKLAGIIEPNDGECHLNEDNEYTHSLLQDYPSISHIDHVVQNKSFNIIFAVTQSNAQIYKLLANSITGASTGTLNEDSSNIIALVEDEYRKARSTVELREKIPKNIGLRYFTKCLLNASEPTEINKCDDLTKGSTVDFDVKLVIQSCNNEQRQTVDIRPGVMQDKLLINIEPICNCACELETPADKSPTCNNKGYLKCGICECEEGYSGRNCECDIKIQNNIQKKTDCRKDDTVTIDCSGRGSCICGACTCDGDFDGTYCECDNTNCRKDEFDQLCSDNGKCNCGKCECYVGWKGDACQCSESKEMCMDQVTKKECSGHGKCECGKCVCEIKDGSRYTGKLCEKCPTCSGRCAEFKHCVQCQVHKTGILKDPIDCEKNCSKAFTLTKADKVSVESENEQFCPGFDENNCKFVYVYNDLNEQNILIRAQTELECETQVLLYGVIIGVIATIVLVGLGTLLIWKLLTTIHDRREFAAFEKSRAAAKWIDNSNPLYKGAVSEFPNPMFAETKT